MKKLLLYLVVASLPAFSIASFANPDPNDLLVTGPDQQYSGGGLFNLNAFDPSVRLINTANQGSGVLIGGRSNITIDGQKYHKLSFVTADHVMTNKILNKVGFQASPFFDFTGPTPTQIDVGRFEATINPAANFEYVYSLGLRDMGFLGVTIKYAALTANQNKYLEQLAPTQIGVVADTYRGAATSYGYGVSGGYQYDTGFNKIGFKAEAGKPFGTHRYVNHTIKRGGTHVEGNYNYDQLGWDCSSAIGQGQMAPGDSGGAFMVDNKLAGINTWVTRTTSDLYGEYYKFGTAGGAYRFSADDKTWLLSESARYQAVPEPISLIAICVGIAGLARKTKIK